MRGGVGMYVSLCALYVSVSGRVCVCMCVWVRKRERHLECSINDNTPGHCAVTGFPEVSWNLPASKDMSELSFQQGDSGTF